MNTAELVVARERTNEAAIHERVALRRLNALANRETEAWQAKPFLWEWFWLGLQALFHRAQLRREVAPGHRALEEHEWNPREKHFWHQVR
jgi:hypothetical protein